VRQLNFISIAEPLSHLATLSGLFALFMFLIHRNNLTKSIRALYLLTVYSCLADLSSFVLQRFRINNFFIFHITSIVEIFCFCYFFYFLLENDKIKRSVLISLVVLLFVELMDAFYIDGLENPNALFSLFEAISFKIFSLLFFYQLMKNIPQKNILNYSLFWINSGILIYFAGNLFLFIFSKILLKEHAIPFSHIWMINSFLYLVYNIFISIGVWKSSKSIL